MKSDQDNKEMDDNPIYRGPDLRFIYYVFIKYKSHYWVIYFVIYINCGVIINGKDGLDILWLKCIDNDIDNVDRI